MDDTLVKIGIALASALLGSGGLWAVIQRRTPDASQQQLSRDAFYATLDQREREAQRHLQEREDYWLAELQRRETEWRAELTAKDTQVADVQRRCLLCEAREQGYNDRIDAQYKEIQRLTFEIERLQKQQRNT